MDKKLLVTLTVVVGILLFFIAVIYFITPAKSLPNFFPGFDPSLSKHHYKHGIGAFILGLGLFAYAWFGSGKKSAKKK